MPEVLLDGIARAEAAREKLLGKGGRGRRYGYSTISLAENARRISIVAEQLHRQLEEEITTPPIIPGLPAALLERTCKVLHDAAARSDDDDREWLLSLSRVVTRSTPHDQWAWLLARSANGRYLASDLLGGKRVSLETARRALFGHLPTIPQPKEIAEQILLELYRPEGIRTLPTLREKLKRGRRERQTPADRAPA